MGGVRGGYVTEGLYCGGCERWICDRGALLWRVCEKWMCDKIWGSVNVC